MLFPYEACLLGAEYIPNPCRPLRLGADVAATHIVAAATKRVDPFVVDMVNVCVKHPQNTISPSWWREHHIIIVSRIYSYLVALDVPGTHPGVVTSLRVQSTSGDLWMHTGSKG